MAKKNYAQEFKDKFSFLEKFGFHFSFDPHNPNRPCYKNEYGEIIMWFKKEAGIGIEYDFYLQINGWKIEIDIVKEYRNIIRKSPIFKRFERMFQELFEYYMNLGNDFYGLKVNKSQSNMIISSNDSFDFSASSNNPFAIEKSSRFYFIFIWTIMILLFGQLGILVVCNYVKTYYVLFILKNIQCCLVFISQIICIYLLRNKLAFLSKILMISTPFIFLILLYLFEKRVDYLVYIILTIVSTLYLIVYIVKYFISKKSNDLLNGVLSVFFPFLAFFVKTDELQHYLFFNDKHMQLFLIVGLITGFIVSVIAILLIKKEIEKKNLIGCFLTIFSIVFITVWMIPYLSEQSINYAFDKSEGNICTYQIVDMYKRHTRKTLERYYLVINKDGKLEDIHVSCATYNEFKVGNSISLAYYEGFLNVEYYEYVPSSEYNKPFT